MKMRFAWYAGVSAALAGGVVMSAFHQRANFYSAMVHLSQSSLSLMVLVNLVFVVYGTVIYGLQRLCFGPLRPVEIEQLYEKAWFAVTETCLAMTIFREEVGAYFLVMFTALVTGKVWGWIGEGRVEVLEQQPPANPRLFHTRLSISLLVSIIYDAWLLMYAVNTVVRQARPTMMVMFLFEFAVLIVCSFQTGSRYLISLAEQRVVKLQTQQRLEERRRQIREERAAILRRWEIEGTADDGEELPDENDVDEMDIEVPGWESKGQWVLTLDLLADFVKLAIYTAFFCVLFAFYGLPIHIIRDWFMTTRSFLKRLNALIRYRQALKDMNQYSDATSEELDRENTCIICREEMRPWDPADATQVERTRAKKLPCGHILHFGCLKSWLERQQVCPTCRRSVAREGDQPARNGEAMVFRLGLNLAGARNRQPPPQANGQAPAGQAAPAPANGEENNQNQNRGVRMFNLGPLRLGIAQGGVNDIQEMAQRLGMPANADNVGVATPAPNPQPRSNDPTLSLEQIRAQLLDVGQRVQQEMQALQAAAHELQTLNYVVNELSRIRQMQQQPRQPQPTAQQPVQQPIAAAAHPAASAGPAAPVAPVAPVAQHAPAMLAGQGPFHTVHHPWTHYPVGGYPAMTPVQPTAHHIHHSVGHRPSAAYTTQGNNGYGTAIPSGSPDLPEGVVIPPGWSLLPLQRLDGWPGLGEPPITVPQRFRPRNPPPPRVDRATQEEADRVLEGTIQALATVTNPDMAVDTTRDATTDGITHTAADIITDTAADTTTGEAGPGTGTVSDTTTGTAEVADTDPVVPNWGGSAQYFSANHSSSNKSSTVAQDEPGESSSQSVAPMSSFTAGGEQDKGEEKGKAKAASVEEAYDDEDTM